MRPRGARIRNLHLAPPSGGSRNPRPANPRFYRKSVAIYCRRSLQPIASQLSPIPGLFADWSRVIPIWVACENLIERAPDTEAAAVEDVGVDHGRTDVAVAEELLDGSDVVARFQEVSVATGLRWIQFRQDHR